MSLAHTIVATPNRRISLIALLVVGLDQFTKQIVLHFLGYSQEKIVIDGFFKFVHWGNTGAAWSMFRGNNHILAIVAVIALAVLFFSRHHFDSRTLVGQAAFGMVFGGIIGNLIDRVLVGHVIDFLYFYVQTGAREYGFPAFNVADSAICVGVGLVMILTWRSDRPPKVSEAPPGPPEGGAPSLASGQERLKAGLRTSPPQGGPEGGTPNHAPALE